MPDPKIYEIQSLDMAAMAQELVAWYQSKGFEAQVVNGPGGGYMVQTRGKDFFTKHGVALTVTMTHQDGKLVVQTGSAKWVNQAVNGVVALILFWPLLALPAYAAIKQKQVIDDTWQFIGSYVASAGGNPAIPQITMPAPPPSAKPVPAPSSQTCPACGESVRTGAVFCDKCGASLVKKCASCGAELRPDAKFCDSCGAAAE